MSVRFDESIAELQSELTTTKSFLSPEELREHWESGTALFENHDFDEAAKAFRRILRQTVKSTIQAPLWANIGICHAHMGEYFSASQTFERAARLDPGNAIYWYTLSLANFNLKDYRKANRYTDACLACFPRSVEHIDCITLGLNFILGKAQVEENSRNLILYINWKLYGTVLEHPVGLNRLPAGRVFHCPIS